MILGGLVDLYRSEGDSSPLALAHRIARAGLEHNTVDGVITEVGCGGGPCTPDGTQFKGIFVRNLIELLRVTPSTDALVPLLRARLERSAEAAWDNRNDDETFPVHWQSSGVSTAWGSTQSAGLDLLLATLAARTPENCS